MRPFTPSALLGCPGSGPRVEHLRREEGPPCSCRNTVPCSRLEYPPALPEQSCVSTALSQALSFLISDPSRRRAQGPASAAQVGR